MSSKLTVGLATSLVLALGAASIGTGAARPAPKKVPAKNLLLPKGKAIVMAKNCGRCHGPNLEGKPDRAPGLRGGDPLDDYNGANFARLMKLGLNEHAKKVKKPMPTYGMSAADSAAVYAYLKSLK